MNIKLLLFISVALAWNSLLVAGDWAHWRGPEQNGISRETNLPETWDLESKKNVLWTSDIGGRATPIILNNRLYLNCRTADDVVDPETKIHAREQVVCLAASTGELIWKDVFNVFQTDIPAPRVGWAAMCGDHETGNVYVHSVSGIFRCYNADGKVLWEHSLFEDFGKISGYGGRTQTPIIDEDRVIVSFLCLNWGETAKPPPKQTYYAFDKKTGKLLWVSAPGGPPQDTNYSCPVLAVINGQRLLIGGNSDGGVYAINARTGEPVWGFKMSKRGLNATAAVEENRVYISHGEDNIDSVRFGRIECIDGTGKGDVTKTHSIWRVDDIKAGYTALLVKDGIVYVVADTGKLYAFDSKTGEELWVHSIGTVGKGSPIWADGKIYVMEVNGNIHILKPSREKCETLSHVALTARVGKGLDEIYASPAVSNGRVFFVTRDRTICIAKPDAKPHSEPVPPLPKEAEPDGKIAQLRLTPYETYLKSGESVAYELLAYDRNGRFLKKLEPKLELGPGLSEAKVAGAKLTTTDNAKTQAGVITVRHEGLTAQARLRVFQPLPWKWDFEKYTGKQVPVAWVNAFLKLAPEQTENGVVMKNSALKGRPSAQIWLGPAEMKGYTIQADVMMKEQRRRLPSVGITAQRYNLILKGNNSKLSIQSWAPHLRMAKEIGFRSDPDVWYRMKMKVDIADGQATVRGKVWQRDEEEPKKWTLEAVDPHPNEIGSPGLYIYALAETYFDNVTITQE